MLFDITFGETILEENSPVPSPTPRDAAWIARRDVVPYAYDSSGDEFEGDDEDDFDDDFDEDFDDDFDEDEFDDDFDDEGAEDLDKEEDEDFDEEADGE